MARAAYDAKAVSEGVSRPDEPVVSHWGSLSVAQQQAAKTLGWDEPTWESNELPPIFLSSWSQLTDIERDAAMTLGYDSEEWANECESTSDESSSEEEIPMTDADNAIPGARVPLAEQIEVCQRRWWADLPDKGAVSRATMHDLQWHTGDLSDGDENEWEEGGWRPWLGDGHQAVAPAELKLRGNKAFAAGDYTRARRLYCAVPGRPRPSSASCAHGPCHCC
eukprot:COSAG05_NODE_289_length_12065_cov_9.271519_8_plen_222_part_00